MNTGQGQPQGQPQPNAGAGVQQQQQPRPQQPAGGQQAQVQQPQGLLYRPDQIKTMVGLSNDERNKYAAGLEMLWQKVNTTPQGSQENKAARDKISNFSSMLTARLRDRKQKSEEAKAEQQGQPAQQPVQQVQKQGVPQQQQQQQQAPAQPAGGQPQAQQMIANNMGGVPQNGNGVVPQQGGQTQTQPPQANSLPESIAAHLRTIQFKTPPQLADKPNAEIQKWFTEMRTKYGRALFSLESNRAKVKAIDKQLAARQAANSPPSDEELKKMMEQKATHQKQQLEASRWVETFRRQHIQDPNAANANANAGQKPDAARPNTPAAPQNMAQGNNNPTPAVATNAAPDVPKVQPQQTPVPPPRVPQPSDASSTNNQVPPQSVHNSQPASQPVQPQIPAAVQRPQPQQQTPTNNSHPSQQQAAAAQNASAQRVQTPQTTTPVNPGGPTRALSHSAAMTLANQRAATGSAPPQGQQHGGTPTTAGPTAGSHPPQQPAQQTQHHQMQHQQPQQGHPHAHPTQQQPTMQSKMPIPKALPDKTTAVPQGVILGGGVKAGRPTVSQGSGTLGGVMNQPAVNKIPAFSNEAEHDHVLSKKKLDELVRQVCGGASEGQEGNLLTPEVEENVLNMADSFVDNVLQVACKNAKERGSKVLEIRDIQLVLERTYNIRVPGYSSDELRTVRKVQPSAGWIAKMSAVQAAKVMPNKHE